MANEQSPRTTSQIASATQVPTAYLAKLLQSLVRAGVMRSQRGGGGGISLAIPPEKLTILDIVNAVDPLQRITTCPLGLTTHGKRLCALHRRLDDAMSTVEQAFANSTLADILNDAEPDGPLCETPS